KIEKNTDFKTCKKLVNQVEQIFLEELEKLKRQEKEAYDAAKSLRKEATYDIHNANTSSTNLLNTARPDDDTARPYLKDDKAKGVAFKDSKSIDRPARSIITLKPLLTIDPKDKGKGVLEEPESAKKMTKSNFDAAQIVRDEEIAR
nr:hypothetical protein [Tanacetum cinerariifolium]